jgi:diguanylate cyclase (GGDEF)-like protein/PAS domain S-box-containing protein/putative nucleotidyltransferase with HDIG domain
VIISTVHLGIMMDAVLLQVVAELQVDAADILLLNSDTQVLEYLTGTGFRTQMHESVRVPVARSLAGRVAKERHLLKVEDLTDQPEDPFVSELLAKEGFISYFGVPLIIRGKVRGVLEVFHRTTMHPYEDWVDFLNALAGQAVIAIENASLFADLEQTNRELSQAYDATIEGWSRALDLRDKETEGHTLRVTELTQTLAQKFDFTDKQMLHIRWGALLHDIGKMGVPDSILLKPEELSEEEWVIMRQHPQYAYDLLQSIAFLSPALDIPYCHHERWDGKGYPRGLKGEEIPCKPAFLQLWMCGMPYPQTVHTVPAGRRKKCATISSELRYRRLFEAAQDGILLLDAANGAITDVNPFLIKLLGYSREEFLQKKLWEVGAFQDIEASQDTFAALQENEYVRYEDLPLRAKTGRLIDVEFVSNVYLRGRRKGHPVQHPRYFGTQTSPGCPARESGAPARTVGAGPPDRAVQPPLYGGDPRARAAARERANICRLGIIMLDMDDLKRFNDSWGHAAGDEALRQLGSLLLNQVRGEDIACRYGGDEFILILPDASHQVTLRRAEQIGKLARWTYLQFDGQGLPAVTLSLGVAIFPEHGRTSTAILKAADAALYRAKHAGRNRAIMADANETPDEKPATQI